MPLALRLASSAAIRSKPAAQPSGLGRIAMLPRAPARARLRMGETKLPLPKGFVRSSTAVRAGDEDASLQAEELELDAAERMDKSLDSVLQSFGSIRTGRANPALLDRVEVDYYGAPTQLKSLAGISVPDAETLIVTPYDKTALQDIDRAIAQSDVGLTPNNDGEKIRLIIPQLTEERRKEMTKLASKLGEEGKVAIRNIRRDVMKSLGKLDLPEDDENGYKDEFQKLTDDYIKKIDEMVKSKEKELTTI